MSGTNENRGSQGVQGSPNPSASVVPVVPAPTGSPKQNAALDVLASPWRHICPEPLKPWLDPASPCQDPWSMAEQCRMRYGNQEYWQWAQEPINRQKASVIKDLREALSRWADGKMQGSWAKRTASIQTLPPPAIPREVSRLLPPQSSRILEEAWQGCIQAMLWEEWSHVSTPKWAIEAMLPPWVKPGPAPIPASPVNPGPEVWLAWTSPEPGKVEPLLVLATHPPMAGELPELRHRESGMIVVPSLVGTAVSLEQPKTESIIRAVAHYGGVWVDETSAEN